jgi:hypothetical protein
VATAALVVAAVVAMVAAVMAIVVVGGMWIGWMVFAWLFLGRRRRARLHGSHCSTRRRFSSGLMIE